MAAVSPVPTDTRPFARLPADDIRADRVNNAGNFMAGDSRILNVREQPHHGDGIAVADATCLHFYAHFIAARLGNVASTSSRGPFGLLTCTARI